MSDFALHQRQKHREELITIPILLQGEFEGVGICRSPKTLRAEKELLTIYFAAEPVRCGRGPRVDNLGEFFWLYEASQVVLISCWPLSRCACSTIGLNQALRTDT